MSPPMLRKALLGLALCLAVLVVALPCWIAVNRRDLAQVDDADLLASAPERDGANGYSWLLAAAEAARLPEDFEARARAIRERETWEPEWLEAVLEENRAALGMLERALDAPRMRVVTSDPDECCDLIPVLQLVRLAVAEAQGLGRAGRVGAAFERALLGMRVGQALSRAENLELIPLMLACSMQSMALGEIEQLAREHALAPAAARAYGARLAGHRIGADAWERAWAGEYRKGKRLVLESAESEPAAEEDAGTGVAGTLLELLPRDYLWQTNRTLDELADRYRRLQREASLDCASARAARPEGLGEVGALRMLGIALRPNPAGRIVIAIATPNFDRLAAKRCLFESRSALVRTLLAARAHQAATGALPAALADLAPDYLTAVPIDPFDGRPLRYSREAQVVWALGMDLVDDGAPAEPSASDDAAPALSLAF